ncbi:MAG: hypothetical protein HPY45_01440 [Anaerolineae bacterium]|nr:hypothetical protein [Anaerolineae bacterium]
MLDWQFGLLVFFRTVSQILTAGVAITAFSLLLYALTFNLRDRVARSYALILTCIIVIFTAEALGGAVETNEEVELWLRVEWVGIVFLPSTYLYFSDSLLTTTGESSHLRRRWMTRLAFAISFLMCVAVPSSNHFEAVLLNYQPGSYLQPRGLMRIFTFYYLVVMVITWLNFSRTFLRARTPTSRRRMGYLIIGALAPAFGSFPYMIFGAGFAERSPTFFWFLTIVSNVLVGSLILLMAYSVAFFGVSWSDRVAKSRLFKWVVRGPMIASLTLASVTIVRRAGALFGQEYSAFVPIVMVFTVLLSQYLITIFSPLWERVIFSSKDRRNLELLHTIEDGLLTNDDLNQFIELVLASVCDRLQTPGAYLASLERGKPEIIVTVGRTSLDERDVADELVKLVANGEGAPAQIFRWGEDLLLPLRDAEREELIGVLGITASREQKLDGEQMRALYHLAGRASRALHDRRAQQEAFQSLQSISSDVAFIRQVRAAAQYNEADFLMDEASLPSDNMTHWVKEALTHYWGGPRLTESPLLQLQVVKDGVEEHDGSSINALRSVLRVAIEKIRPEGERRFTGEWILYNILEMKFMEGKKVREIARRLAMSEADLYRKQRIAIEAVGNAILEMENQARNGDLKKNNVSEKIAA